MVYTALAYSMSRGKTSLLYSLSTGNSKNADPLGLYSGSIRCGLLVIENTKTRRKSCRILDGHQSTLCSGSEMAIIAYDFICSHTEINCFQQTSIFRIISSTHFLSCVNITYYSCAARHRAYTDTMSC